VPVPGTSRRPPPVLPHFASDCPNLSPRVCLGAVNQNRCRGSISRQCGRAAPCPELLVTCCSVSYLQNCRSYRYENHKQPLPNVAFHFVTFALQDVPPAPIFWTTSPPSPFTAFNTSRSWMVDVILQQVARIPPCSISFPLGFFIVYALWQFISVCSRGPSRSLVASSCLGPRAGGRSRFQILPDHIKHLFSIGAIDPDDPFQARQVIVADQREIKCPFQINQPRADLGPANVLYEVCIHFPALCSFQLRSKSGSIFVNGDCIPPQASAGYVAFPTVSHRTNAVGVAMNYAAYSVNGSGDLAANRWPDRTLTASV
jgi:hypothetical protein